MRINRREDLLISIIIPTYNVEDHIDRCLESCLNQSYSNIEVIIVDDCGQDNSIVKACCWAEKDDRISIVRNPRNLGTYHARRVGVEHALGDYIFFVDPDDSIEKNACMYLCAAASETEPDIIFYCFRELPKPRFYSHSFEKKSKLDIPHSLHMKKSIYKKLNYGTAGKVYSKSLIKSAYRIISVPESERLVVAEDALIFYAALSLATSAKSVKRPIYNYHRNDTSITKMDRSAGFEFKQEQIDKVIFYMKNAEFKLKEVGVFTCDITLIMKIISNRLLSDKYLCSRFFNDKEGRSMYLNSIWKAFYINMKVKILIKIFLYVVSFGKLKT